MSATHIFIPTNLGVEEAIPLVRNSLGNISYEQEVTVRYNTIFISTCDISEHKKAATITVNA